MLKSAETSRSTNTAICNVMAEEHYLFLEPFYGGSHKQLIDTVIDGIQGITHRENVHLISLPAKKWHWRARTSALYLSQTIPHNHEFKVLFASSVLNLAELIALRPDLLTSRKIVYFHENQLVYPVQEVKNRDFQFGYNQILTCLVTDIIIFNSNFNKDSFLNNIGKFLKLQPSFRPKKLKEQIEVKCRVLYFPIEFPSVLWCPKEDSVVTIVWPHRWEHDKDPEKFFRTLSHLVTAGKNFRISVLGETFSEEPQVFQDAKQIFANHIIHWGHLESKEAYYKVLRESHLVVSTSRHEFYGVAMLEASYCGCFPLCPNALVYPEIYPKQCLYENEAHLVEKLMDFCDDPASATSARENLSLDFSSYSSEHLMPKYQDLFRFE